MSVEETLEQRGGRYGNFYQQASLTMVLQSAISRRLDERDVILEPDQTEAMQMICMKLARIANGDPNYADNWHDIAGYATLVAARLAAEEARA